MYKEESKHTQFADNILKLGRDLTLEEQDLDRQILQIQKDFKISDRQAAEILRRRVSKEESNLQVKLTELEVAKQQLDNNITLLQSNKDCTLTGSERIQQFKNTFPDIWQDVAGRIYKNTDSYGNYRLAYLEWGWAFMMQKWYTEPHYQINTEDIKSRDAIQEVIDTFHLHKEHNFPFFFVSKGICDAAWQSDLKFDVEWKTMRLPFEAFTFILPKDNPVGYEGVIIHRYIKDGDTHLQLSALNSNSSLGRGFGAKYPFKVEDNGDHLLRWVFNTIFAMSARPEYVEGGERLGTKKGSTSEIWSPNVIGRKYAIKSHTFTKESGGSVRLHWRRGHFRQQAYGIARSKHKIIWIEPMMVGATKS